MVLRVDCYHFGLVVAWEALLVSHAELGLTALTMPSRRQRHPCSSALLLRRPFFCVQLLPLSPLALVASSCVQPLLPLLEPSFSRVQPLILIIILPALAVSGGPRPPASSSVLLLPQLPFTFTRQSASVALPPISYALFRLVSLLLAPLSTS